MHALCFPFLGFTDIHVVFDSFLRIFDARLGDSSMHSMLRQRMCAMICICSMRLVSNCLFPFQVLASVKRHGQAHALALVEGALA